MNRNAYKLLGQAALFLLFINFLVFALSAFGECSSPRGAVIFYEHPYYEGHTLAYRGAVEVGNLRDKSKNVYDSWNDSISSIEIPEGYRVILYSDKYYGGGSITLTRNTSRLFNVGWDNIASSLRIERVGSCVSQPMAIFYDQPGYKGRSFILYAGESMRRLRDKRRGSGNWDNKIESVRIIGNFDVELFDYTRYSGERLVISKSESDLRYLEDGWDDRASSVWLGEAE